MKKNPIHISADISLPLDLVTQTAAILAKRRAGKSYTMRRIAEQLLKASQQIVIVDPKGDQWGIRSSADGKKKGYPVVILGGEHGDVPLEPSAGELIAKLVVYDRVSIVLDLSSFRKHEIATFMTDFLESLYRLKAQEKYRTPTMLIIDEADAIAPQKPQPNEARMLGAAEDIVRRGGQRGLGCILVTQRSAVLNKNVLTQAEMLVVLRTIAPQDLSAMKAWIDVHGDVEEGKELLNSLPSLPIGDAYFWSPGWPTSDGIFKRTHVLPIETFDSGATPKPGERKIVPKKLADVDLEALKGQMAETMQKAKENDPKELKKRIAELERQARIPITTTANTKAAAITAHLPQADWAKALEAAEKKGYETGAKNAETAWRKEAERVRLDGEREVNRLRGILKKILGLADPDNTWKPSDVKIPNAPVFTKTHTIQLSHPGGGGGKLPAPVRAVAQDGEPRPIQGGALRMLKTLVSRYPMEFTRPQLGTLSDVKHSGGSFGTYLSQLRQAGYLEEANGKLRATDAGIEYLGEDKPAPQTPEEVRDMWRAKLQGGARRMFEALEARYPDGYTREELGEAAQVAVSGGSFGTYLSQLRSNGLLQEEGPTITLSETLTT